MPTGYTSGLTPETPVREFILRCARAMGACISMKDACLDAPLPERFKPCSYYREGLDEAQSRLIELESMDAKAIEQAEAEDWESELQRTQKRKEEMERTAEAYRRMILGVESWRSPTEDHKGLKKFMLEQLREGIKFDVHRVEEPERTSADRWHADQLAKAARDIEYHGKEYAEEISRVQGWNKWLRELRESLPNGPE